MRLQLTTLAEMTNNTGTYLLPQVLNTRGQAYPPGLESISFSTLQWPRVSNPTANTWNFWTRTIRTLFTGSATGSKLHHPLGCWTPDYDMHRFWKWRLTPTKRLLHCKQPNTTTRVALLVKTQRRHLAFSATIPTNQEFEGTPVTPTDTHCRIIPLPVTNRYPSTNEPTPWRSFTSIIDQFRQHLAAWQHPLFGPITKCQPTPMMNSVCLNHGLISLASDASVQKNKQSGFAWVITHKNTKLWKGVGLAPGTAEDIYSGRAEAFSLLAGLLFIQSYLSYYSGTYDGAQIQCFCDNQGIISNINSMRDTTTTRPNDATNDDYDVYRTICDTAQLCDPITITFWHVKGHQDRDSKRPLTHIEQLNVECDTRAKRYTTTTSQSSTALGNPSIPAAQPHLCIGKKIICRNVMPTLRWTVSTPEYRKDLQQKYHWSMSDFENINWNSFQAALKSFQSEDQRRIILFVSDKLPLRASKAHPHHGSPLCPSCKCESETAQHFLTC